MHLRFRLFSLLGLGICPLLLLAGCGKSPGSRSEAAEEPAGDVPKVSVVTPEFKTLRRTTTQPATVSAYYEADIYAKVAGYLAEIKHDIGDTVEAKAVLGIVSVPELSKQLERQQAEIQKQEADEKRAVAEVQVAQSMKTAADAELTQAQASVTQAVALVTADKRELDRTRDLVERRSVADRLLDESQKRFESSEAAQAAAEAAVTSAQAKLTVADSKIAAAQADHEAAKAQTEVARKQWEETQALLDYATLSAPFAGVVTARHVDVGDLVRNTQTAAGKDSLPLFSVAQVDTVRVRVAIPENDAPFANPGDKVSIRLRAVSGPPIEEKLKRVSRRLDPSTRTMLAEIELDNKAREMKLLPGMFGEVTITLEEREALVLPAGVVRYDEQGKAYVYAVAADNTVSRIEVTTGMDDGKEIEITGGLTGSERLVTNTIGRLNPGQKVQVQ